MADWLANHWGDMASVLGLVVSMVGFAFAIWQLTRTRRAAEAAEQAAKEARSDFAKSLAIGDLREASGRIELIKEMHLQGNWERALDRYRDLTRMLADIIARHPSLTAEQQANLRDAREGILSLDVYVRQALRDNNSPDNLDLYDALLSRTQSTLDELSAELEQTT